MSVILEAKRVEWLPDTALFIRNVQRELDKHLPLKAGTIAKRAGKTNKYFSTLFNRKKNESKMKVETAVEVAEIFGKPLEYFLRPDEEMSKTVDLAGILIRICFVSSNVRHAMTIMQHPDFSLADRQSLAEDLHEILLLLEDDARIAFEALPERDRQRVLGHIPNSSRAIFEPPPESQYNAAKPRS